MKLSFNFLQLNSLRVPFFRRMWRPTEQNEIDQISDMGSFWPHHLFCLPHILSPSNFSSLHFLASTFLADLPHHFGLPLLFSFCFFYWSPTLSQPPLFLLGFQLLVFSQTSTEYSNPPQGYEFVNSLSKQPRFTLICASTPFLYPSWSEITHVHPDTLQSEQLGFMSKETWWFSQ